MKPLSVLIIASSYPRWKDDFAGHFVERIAGELSASGVEVEVVAPSDRSITKKPVHEAFPVHRFRYFFKRMEGLAYGYGGIVDNLRSDRRLWAEVIPFVFFFMIAVMRIGRSSSLVHCNWLMNAICCLGPKRLFGTPFVLTLRGKDMALLSKGKIFRRLGVFLLGQAEAVTTVNEEFVTQVRDLAPGTRVYYVPNGVDLIDVPLDAVRDFKERNRLDSKGCLIVYIGSLVEGKGLDVLIAALEHLDGRPFQAALIGDGPMRNSIREQIKRARLEDRITLTGLRPHSEIPYWLAASKFLVLPSRSEGRPNVVLEAMAAGKPVVATRLPGTAEIVEDGKSGILVEIDDVVGLKNAISRLLSDEELRKTMGARGKGIIRERKLSWSHCAKQYLEIFHDIRK